MTDLWNTEGDSINSQKKIMLKQIDTEIVGPKRIYDPMYIENPAPLQPVEYYDNEDGYWDDYIKKKEELRGRVPIPRYRPYYKH